jgi:hypothetical protein
MGETHARFLPAKLGKRAAISLPSASFVSRTSHRVASGALWAQVGMAHTSSPFAAFFGSWRGSGRVVGSDGHSERINCRATYSESNGGEALSQTLVCASDSYRFDVRSYVVADGRDVQGHWEETTRNVTGQLSGQVEDGRFDGSIAGPAFTAQMSLKTPQAGDIAEVDIVLSRER